MPAFEVGLLEALNGQHPLVSEVLVLPEEKELPDVPEIRLYRSVLVNGIEDLTRVHAHKGKQAQIRRQAKIWLMSDERSVFSFRTLCELFDIDHKRYRLLILKHRT
jgi:hypothetical protein